MINLYIALAGSIMAVVTDFRDNKIYNWLTFTMLAIGVIMNYYLYGVTGLEMSIIGAILFGLSTYVGIGACAGDYKLAISAGSIVGAFDWGLYLIGNGIMRVVMAIYIRYKMYPKGRFIENIRKEMKELKIPEDTNLARLEARSKIEETIIVIGSPMVLGSIAIAIGLKYIIY